MVYNSQMRRRVTRWYRVVHEIDHKLAHCTPEEASAAAGRLRAVQEEILNMTPPSAGFMGELYDLKLHIEWLLRHAEAQAATAPRAHSPR
jgi:hypothetical protein